MTIYLFQFFECIFSEVYAEYLPVPPLNAALQVLRYRPHNFY